VSKRAVNGNRRAGDRGIIVRRGGRDGKDAGAYAKPLWEKVEATACGWGKGERRCREHGRCLIVEMRPRCLREREKRWWGGHFFKRGGAGSGLEERDERSVKALKEKFGGNQGKSRFRGRGEPIGAV